MPPLNSDDAQADTWQKQLPLQLPLWLPVLPRS